MFGFKSYEGGMLKITSALCLLYASSIELKKIDILIIIYILYCLFSYGWGDVTWEIYYDGIVTQLMPISLYFLMRIRYFSNCTFLDDMKWPLLFAFVCALFLYFIQPSWYLDFKMRGWSYEYTDTMFYERTRLSGFWPWPYFIGTASLFYIMYELKKIVDGRLVGLSLFLSRLSVVVAVVVLFFAQLRVAIAYLFVYFFFLFLYMSYKKKISFKSFGRIPLLICVFVVLILFILRYVDSELISYMMGRSVNAESNIVADRFAIFSKYINTITVFGEGLGSYSHFARTFGKHYVGDCEYIRIPNEIGVVGFALLLIILFLILCYGVRNYKSCFFEVCVVLYLFASMIGAAPLEHLPLHPYFYWFCMGRIVTKYYNHNVLF